MARTRGRVQRVDARTEELLRDLEARALEMNGKLPGRSETFRACVETFHELVTGRLHVSELPAEYSLRRVVQRVLMRVCANLPDMIEAATGVRVVVELLADGGFRICRLAETSDALFRPADVGIRGSAGAELN